MPHAFRSKASRILSFLSVMLLSAALLLTTFAATAKAEGYRIVKLVNGMNRPDLPCPPCTPFYIYYTPVISGDRVAFLSRNGPPDGVWSADINTRALTKLVGLNTPVPGGTGNFSAFGYPEHRLTIGGGYVAFFGIDGAGILGLYTVPVTGGPVRKVVNTNTVAPDGTEFTDLQRPSLNGPTVVFWGRTPNHIGGIYRATRLGTQLQTVIDSDDRLDARTPAGPLVDYFSGFTRAVIGSANNIFFSASGLFDPVSGPNAIFRAADRLDIADNMTRLQGRPDNSHVRISSFSAAVGSAAVAFHADQPNNGFQGLFKVRSKFVADAFATTKSLAPPTNRKFQSFAGFGYDGTGLAFTGTHATAVNTVDQSVYFVSAPGQPIVRIAAGRNYYFPMVGDRSVSQGRIVFMEGSNFADTVFVAVPIVP